MTYTITENTRYNSIEISFDSIPSAETRNVLKGLKFRWNPKKAIWYGFATVEQISAALDGNNTKEETKAEEPKRAAHFWVMGKDEAAEALKAVGKSDEDISKYYLKYNYIIASDKGEIIKINRGGIESRMYYDDETPAPSTSFESWARYNRNYNQPSSVEQWLKEVEDARRIGCWSGRLNLSPVLRTYEDGFTVCELYTDQSYKWYLDKFPARELNEEETADLVEVLRELNRQYEDRLQKYYKRYADKISTYGYWANR